MASKQAKIIGALLLGGVIIGGVAFASTASAKPKARKPEGDDQPEPMASRDDRVIVDVPTGNGQAVRIPVDVPDDGPARPAGPVATAPSSDLPPLAATSPGLPPLPAAPLPPGDILTTPAPLPAPSSPSVPSSPSSSLPDIPLPTELADRETDARNDPNGTVALARLLIARENAPGWKEDLKPDVEEWQRRVGLGADGKFGLHSAKRMAYEVGILPLVRFWTLGKHWDKASALKDYRATMAGVIADLRKLSPASHAHVRALEASIQREQAQGFPSKPAPVNTVQQIDQIMRQLDSAADEEARRFIEGVA
jgi:hypothetical protein